MNVMRGLNTKCGVLHYRLTVFASVLVVAFAVVAWGEPPIEATAVSHMDSTTVDPYRDPGVFGEYWWANRFLSRHQLVEQFKGRTVDLVMIGDSITHFWERFHPASWGRLVQGRHVLNLGYGGDQTQHVIWRIGHGELDGYTAKTVVVMVGTNNNSSGNTDPANVAEGVKRIVALVREKQPTAKVILHPIFPRGVSAESKYHAAARARNEMTNEILRDFAARDGSLVWIDFNSKFLDADGWVPKTLMADEIHPTDAGYELWLEALQGQL